MMRANETKPGPVSLQVEPNRSLLYPLSEFYGREGLALPAVRPIDGKTMPEPYRTLLVHERDMTPTLARAYRGGIRMRVLQHQLNDNAFMRQVVLTVEGASDPVEFGVIRIGLDHFPTEARRQILEMRLPLGAILLEQGIEHSSRPDAYFEMTPDAPISGALHLAQPRPLYGRHNVIADRAGRVLAEVVEVLPPANGNLRLEENFESE